MTTGEAYDGFLLDIKEEFVVVSFQGSRHHHLNVFES